MSLTPPRAKPACDDVCAFLLAPSGRRNALRGAWRLARLLLFLLWSVPCRSFAKSAPEVLLVAGGEQTAVAQGLQSLGVRYSAVPPGIYPSVSPFDYDVVVWGPSEPTGALAAESGQAVEFVRRGGVLLLFRQSAAERWVPVPLQHDKSFSFGAILKPEHPIFTVPHSVTEEDLRQMHGGIVHNALYGLGEGWEGLASADIEEGADPRKPADAGGHYGMVELCVGKGRIVLVQMAPLLHWFHDHGGESSVAGGRLFENLVAYVQDQAASVAAHRPARVVPAGFRRDVAEVALFYRPEERESAELHEWDFESRGPYRLKRDGRGVLTFTHPSVPSSSGNYAQVVRTFDLPAYAGCVTLRWYQSDTFCGGLDVLRNGEWCGASPQENLKPSMRFAQVWVNGQLVWEQDVSGRNLLPASSRIHLLDVTREAAKRRGACEVTLRVEDRSGSAPEPFAVDVFWGAVSVSADMVLAPALRVADAEGFSRRDDGALALSGKRGRLGWRHRAPSGTYVVGIELRDGVAGRSKLRMKAGRKVIGSWDLTADDHRVYWALTDPVELEPDTEISVSIKGDGDEQIEVRRVAVIPERCLRRPAQPPAAPPVSPPSASPRFSGKVTETAGVSRDGEIAVQGFPFSQGALKDASRLRVVDGDGQELPVQTRTIVTWPDGSVKSLLTCFPVDVDPKQTVAFTVTAGKEVEPSPLSGALTVLEEHDMVRVDTGVVSVVLSKSEGRLFEEVKRGEDVMKLEAEVWDFVIQDEAGRLFTTSGHTVVETRVVEAGPLRALIVRKGEFANEDGRLLGYRMTFEATAASDVLRVETTIVNREDTPEVYLRQWSMVMQKKGAASGVVHVLPDDPRKGNVGALLYQHSADLLTWTGADGRREREAGRSPGIVRLPGVAVVPRWFWQRYPRGLQLGREFVRFDFIPEAYDNADLPTRWRDRLLEQTDRYSVGGVGYPQCPGRTGLFRLDRGEALSQEVVFAFDGRALTAPVSQASAACSARLRAAPDPDYVSRTGVFGTLHPASSTVSAEHEAAVEAVYQRYIAKRERRREYGMENFGDDTVDWGRESVYTFWGNADYDRHHAFAAQFLRSGDLRWWELCEQQARMFRDVVVVHHALPGELRIGGPRHPNVASPWMPPHPEQFWIADHTRLEPSPGRSWARGLVDYWLLTGDPWTREVLLDMANWYSGAVQTCQFGGDGPEAGPGRTLQAIVALAQVLGDELVRDAGQTVVDTILEQQDPLRGVVSVPIPQQASYEGGTTFMHGTVGRALGSWYELTGDSRARDGCVAAAEWLVAEAMTGPGRFQTHQCPELMRVFEPVSEAVCALSYAYRLTGDSRFGAVAQALLSRSGVSLRSLNWMPEVMEHLAELHRPISVALRPEVCRMETHVSERLEVLVRNTGEETVSLEYGIEAPDLLEIDVPTGGELAAGETARDGIWISGAPEPGRWPLLVDITATKPDGTKVVRSVPFVVHVSRKVVRDEASLANADIMAPMVLCGEGEEAYAHTPRERESASLARRSDGGHAGQATWSFSLEEDADCLLWAHVRWLDDGGDSFHASLDGGPKAVVADRGGLGEWFWIELPGGRLGAGPHTVTIRTREAGAQVRGVRLVGTAVE